MVHIIWSFSTFRLFHHGPKFTLAVIFDLVVTFDLAAIFDLFLILHMVVFTIYQNFMVVFDLESKLMLPFLTPAKVHVKRESQGNNAMSVLKDTSHQNHSKPHV